MQTSRSEAGAGLDKKNKFTIRMQRKLVVLFCLVLLAFAGLSVRLILINRRELQKAGAFPAAVFQYDDSL